MLKYEPWSVAAYVPTPITFTNAETAYDSLLIVSVAVTEELPDIPLKAIVGALGVGGSVVAVAEVDVVLVPLVAATALT